MSGGNYNNGRRKGELPANWQTKNGLRDQVIRRDGGLCQQCGQPGNQVDHIVRGDNHSLTNLQLLCTHCHNKKSSSEGGLSAQQKRREMDADRRRRFGHQGNGGERHPGLL